MDDNYISAYPNPFVEDNILKLNLKNETSKLNISVTDIYENSIFYPIQQCAKGLVTTMNWIERRSLKS